MIGGGVNCPAKVRDAAVRCLKVTRAERANLAWGLSRVCSALLHGGLRYLGHLVLRLVRQSLNERQTTGRVIAGILRISIQEVDRVTRRFVEGTGGAAVPPVAQR